MDKPTAIEELAKRHGRAIIVADLARDIAGAFGVGLDETPGELQPISEMDRMQPDNDRLGIGIGSLCKVIAEKRGDIDAEEFTALGHGTTQDGLKDRNFPKLVEVA